MTKELRASVKARLLAIPTLRLFTQILPEKWQLMSAFGASLVYRTLESVPNIFIGLGVGIVVTGTLPQLSRWGVTSQSGQLALICMIIVITYGIQTIFGYFSNTLWRSLSQLIQHRLRLKTYNHLQNLSMQSHEEMRTGSIAHTLNNDLNQIEAFIDAGIVEIINLTVGMLYALILFWFLDFFLALCLFFLLPILGTIIFLLKKYLLIFQAKASDHAASMGALLVNAFAGITTVKGHNAHGYEHNRLKAFSEHYRKVKVDSTLVRFILIGLLRITVITGIVSIVFFGGMRVLYGVMSIAIYTTVLAEIQRALWPIIKVGDIINSYSKTSVAAVRVFSLLDIPNSMRDGHRVIRPESIEGHITFSDVAFNYPNGTSVYDTLSFTINAGHKVAFVGSTGSGKSTLIKLLLRFYDPHKGSILIDNINIRDVSLHSLRSAIGLVSQEVFLFHGTVRDNIAYGSPEITHDALVEAARAAQIHDHIEQLPDGYDTIIGDWGQKMSGGQRQRISIARTLLKNPPILILDEATSAADYETEKALKEAIEEYAQGKTLIFISHRLPLIRHVNEIFFMDKGVIVESGHHDALIEQGGSYADLWNIQLSSFR